MNSASGRWSAVFGSSLYFFGRSPRSKLKGSRPSLVHRLVTGLSIWNVRGPHTFNVLVLMSSLAELEALGQGIYENRVAAVWCSPCTEAAFLLIPNSLEL